MQKVFSLNELIDASEKKLSIHTIKDYCRRGELHPCIYFEGNIVCIHDERFKNSIDKCDPVAHIETVGWARTFKGYISASNFIDYIADTDTQTSGVFFNVTKIVEHISLTNDFPLLQKDEYLKAFPSRIDDEIQEKRWLHEINDFKGNVFKAHEIVFHASEVEKLLLTHSRLPKSSVKVLNYAGDLGVENLQEKENSNIKKTVNLKDMLEDMDDYISVSSVFELIKERTDLGSDSEVANFLIVHKNDLPNPVNKFDYFDGKPTPLYKDFQQNQLTKMDLLLLEIAREELKLNSDDGRLKKFAWEKFDFFLEFRCLTNVDLYKEVYQFDEDDGNSEKISHQEADVNQSESVLLLQDQSRFGNQVIGHATIEHYQKKCDELSIVVERLKLELLEKDYQIKELKSSQQANQTDLISLIYDETKKERYAPDLVFAINAWKFLYIDNKETEDKHSNRVNYWIKKNTPYQKIESVEVKRLREITSPFESWHIDRKNKFNK
ncbi:hypothetical protein [Acinetobacter sp. SA01]|uniref:hypothetical protein n=1 Tax=Acinetobacter sp. SA01 TaxID=1862567 RepID=UPI001F102AF9|nr:hypothetical protein [Acinetobacter sp. SA01]